MTHLKPRAEQALTLAQEEAERIRQDLAVLKSKVEKISATVDEASEWPRKASPSSFLSSLRRLSGPQTPITSKVMGLLLHAALGLLALFFLSRMIGKRFRKP